MVTVFLLGNQGISIKEIIKKMKDTDTVKCTGSTDLFIKVNGYVAFNMEMGK